MKQKKKRQNKTLFILNPTSRSGRGKKIWRFFSFIPGPKKITVSRKDAIQSARLNNAETIVAVGGDGTINQCVNGIMTSTKSKRLAVIYAGTSPDFCRFHQIPVDPQAAINTLLNGNETKVDVCRLTDNKIRHIYFSSDCNIGLGATIADIANRIRRYFGDKLGSFIALLIALFKTRPFTVFVRVDETAYCFENICNLSILKNNYIASGMHINTPATPDDGKLHIIAVPAMPFYALPSFLKKVYTGKIQPNITTPPDAIVSVQTSKSLSVELDGDSYNVSTQMTIQCIQKGLRIIK